MSVKRRASLRLRVCFLTHCSFEIATRTMILLRDKRFGAVLKRGNQNNGTQELGTTKLSDVGNGSVWARDCVI